MTDVLSSIYQRLPETEANNIKQIIKDTVARCPHPDYSWPQTDAEWATWFSRNQFDYTLWFQREILLFLKRQSTLNSDFRDACQQAIDDMSEIFDAIEAGQQVLGIEIVDGKKKLSNPVIFVAQLLVVNAFINFLGDAMYGWQQVTVFCPTGGGSGSTFYGYLLLKNQEQDIHVINAN